MSGDYYKRRADGTKEVEEKIQKSRETEETLLGF